METSNKYLRIWINLVGLAGMSFGIFYTFFGLEGFPAYSQLIPKNVLIPWSNGLYGALFIGFSALLFFVGRHAIAQDDKKLMKALLYGIFSWLLVEASVSFYYSVFFNVGVDIALMLFLGLPLVRAVYFSSHRET